jgi:pimeloyl-ACP methyl ester carboxylesterase
MRRWIRLALLVWAAGSTAWLVNSMRTRGVDAALLQSSASVSVVETSEMLSFGPASPARPAGLVFLCGAGVSAQAYVPLLRPVADAGYRVAIVKLPYRFAPLERHRAEAIGRARAVVAGHPELRWILAGHSRGGALAARLAWSDPAIVAGLVLIGTTHPRDQDLSRLTIPVTKIYGSHDGVAPVERVLANRRLVPGQTRWIERPGGNHSQFGHYGHQLFDGRAAMTREHQQAIVRSALLQMLADVGR